MIRALPFCIAASLAQFGAAQSWTLLDTNNTPLVRNLVSFLVFDHENDLWMASEGNAYSGHGIFRFDGTNWTHYDELDHPALTNGVRYAAVDTAGSMWFGVMDKGLLKYDGNDWTIYNTGNSDITSNDVFPIVVDEDNIVWTGTWGGTLSRFDGSTWINKPGHPCMNAIEIYDDKVWVGQDCAGGLDYYDPATDEWTTITGLPHSYISALKNDGQGNLWVGYAFGGNMISRFDGTNWTHYYPFSSPYNGVAYNSLAVDPAGDVWCDAMGLWYYIEPDWFLYGPPLPDNSGGFNLSVAFHPDGWIYWAEYNGIWTNDPSIAIAIPEQGTGRSMLSILPNPAHDAITIGLPAGTGSGTLRLVDARGALAREVRISGGVQTDLERDGLPAGAYSVIMIADKGTQAMGRVIFE